MDKKGVRTLYKLHIPSSTLKQNYVNRYLPGLVDRVTQGFTETSSGNSIRYELSDEAKDILLPDWRTTKKQTNKLKRLLVSEPLALKRLNDEINQDFQSIADSAKRPNNKVLLKIFGYQHVFNTSSKKEAYWLSKEIDSNTCVYCNRQYAVTVENGNGSNAKERIARPAFDHWFDKKDYPLMSLSLCNLIPSCTICNSSVKSATKFDLSTHTHPYIHETGHPNIKFVPTLTTDTPPRWTIKIETPPGSKEEKTVQDMMLQELYDIHGEIEVRDLMNFRDKYPAGFLKQLFEDVLKNSKRNLSKTEVYRMLFGTEMDPSRALDRPLSKLKHDILLDMGVIDR